MLGGLLVGLVESWAHGYLNGNWADLVVFGILIARDARPAERAARHAGAPEGLADGGSTTPTPDAPRPPRRRQIGVDQWVAQSDERRERRARRPRPNRARLRSSCRPPGSSRCSRRRSWSRSSCISSGNLFNYGIFILIYALLALGLNVVVGFAGLLDLGYVAFFGFGAYIYAFLSGTHSEKGHVYTHHWDAQCSILIAVVVCALLGLFLGTSSRRLLGDYLAIVTLFFGQAFVVFTNSADPYGITNGSNGLANVDPLTLLRRARSSIDTIRGYYWFLLGCRGGRPGRALLPERVAHGPRLEGLARGSAGRRADGDAGQPAEDHGLQLRRRDRRPRGQRSSPPCRPARSRRTSAPRC